MSKKRGMRERERERERERAMEIYKSFVSTDNPKSTNMKYSDHSSDYIRVLLGIGV